MSIQDLLIVDSAAQAAAACVVCGKDVPAGGGVTAQYRGQTLRFKCPGCISRFAADPDLYLSGGPQACCEDGEAGTGHDHSNHGDPHLN